MDGAGAKNGGLEVSLEGQVVSVRAIDRDVLTIGREPTCEVALDDRRVSRVHARLIRQGASMVLEDAGSGPGTWIGSVRIERATLGIGQAFRIGPFELKLLPVTSVTPARGAASARSASSGTTGLGELLDLAEVVGITDRKVLLETLLERTMTLLHAASGFIVLARDGKFTSLMSASAGSRAMPEADVISRTFCEQAMREKRSFVLGGADFRTVSQNIPSMQAVPVSGVSVVPLISVEEVLGVMYLVHSAITAIRDVAGTSALLDEVSRLGGRALATARDRDELLHDRERWQWLAGSAQASELPDFAKTCHGPGTRRILQIARRVAREDVTVLIQGESGTGKEILAQHLHALSDRRSGPFVAINCGAIPRELIESELFGHERGAFSGADRRRLGRFELAQGGTLMLDEIGDLPLELQTRLLRVLETRTFERLGGQETLTWNVRILAATHRNLEQAIQQDRFRSDLYYRLGVLRIELPPLRDRGEDLESLVGELLTLTNRRFRRKLLGVTPEAFQVLRNYSWPGNIRELRNVLERAFILEESDYITPDSLPLGPVNTPRATGAPAARATGPTLPLPELPQETPQLADYVREAERHYISRLLEESDGNLSQVARVAGLTRSGLYKKMKSLGMRVEE